MQTTEGTPVELANVVLLSAADSTFLQGTCSRADGSFALSPASPGRYLLQVSCVGYETLLQPTDGQGSITCTLQAVSMALDETVITARRPQYRLKQGGTLETDVRHSLLARLETAADVLARLPGMRGSVEEGFTVFGKGTPLIYIDNRQLQDVTELLRLNAADIDRVELITNPGPEYDAEVKAVIRIRTIRGRDDGWGGNVRLALTQGRRPGHAEQVGMNYQRGGLSVQASAYGNLSQERMGRDAPESGTDGTGRTLPHLARRRRRTDTRRARRVRPPDEGALAGHLGQRGLCVQPAAQRGGVVPILPHARPADGVRLVVCHHAARRHAGGTDGPDVRSTRGMPPCSPTARRRNGRTRRRTT